jgi:hypothetical protein
MGMEMGGTMGGNRTGGRLLQRFGGEKEAVGFGKFGRGAQT